MSFIAKKHLSRRTFLQGMGVSLSLPLLDSMVPAATALARTAGTPQLRMGLLFIPHGAISSSFISTIFHTTKSSQQTTSVTDLLK